MSFYFYFLAPAYVDRDYHWTGDLQENGNKLMRQMNESDIYFVDTCVPLSRDLRVIQLGIIWQGKTASLRN